eukprot:8729113-Alexandrium_andersonii.AAC.1
MYAFGVLGAGVPEPSLLSPRILKYAVPVPPSLPGPAGAGCLGGCTSIIGPGRGKTEGIGAVGAK